MKNRIVAAFALDPLQYSRAYLKDEEFRDNLLLFLETAVRHQVFALDEAGEIGNAMLIQLTDLKAKWPEIGTMLEECLKRKHKFRFNKNMKQVVEQIQPWIEDDKESKAGRLASIALLGEDHIDGVILSKETQEIMSCADLPVKDFPKAISMVKANRLILKDGEPLFGKLRTEIADRWFDPILKWGETVTLVDKFVGTAFRDGKRKQKNWGNFKLTIGSLYRHWKKHKIVQQRWFEVITHPLSEKGRMDEPNSYIAQDIWRELGAKNDMRITIIKEDKYARMKRGDGDVKHERYLNSMPMDFTLSIGRGFDFFKEDEGDRFTQACNISFLSEHPQDLRIILGLRKSGVTYPPRKP